MPDFAKLVRSLIANVADPLTKSLQPLVAVTQIDQSAPPSGGGGTTYLPTQYWPALVAWEQKRVRTIEGTDATTRAKIMFTVPHEIDEADIFVLPDGSTGPVLDMSGFVDKLTGRAFTTTVWLG